ncbi:DUF547 domain-containing protein [Candidatus Gracilibacteria bacterium]|nr:DUF547 domain-containing protein [Candidatus Gracilibacteria bacterium]
MNDYIFLRDSALRLLLGDRSDAVLNERPAPTALSGPQLAAALRSATLALRAEAIADDGLLVDYRRLRASAAYAAYRIQLTPQLHAFDLTTLNSRWERLAFWCNVYNALVIDAVIAYGVQRSVSERLFGLSFFRTAAYTIGGLRFSLDDIEHGILRANRGSPFLPGPQFASADPRLNHVVEPPDLRIHFALNCASRSCPPIAFFAAERVDAQLDLAARSFVAADTVVDAEQGLVRISQIYSWYRADFDGPAGVVRFLQRYLPNDERRRWLNSRQSVGLFYTPYNWDLNAATGARYTPRYVAERAAATSLLGWASGGLAAADRARKQGVVVGELARARRYAQLHPSNRCSGSNRSYASPGSARSAVVAVLMLPVSHGRSNRRVREYVAATASLDDRTGPCMLRPTAPHRPVLSQASSRSRATVRRGFDIRLHRHMARPTGLGLVGHMAAAASWLLSLHRRRSAQDCRRSHRKFVKTTLYPPSATRRAARAGLPRLRGKPCSPRDIGAALLCPPAAMHWIQHYHPLSSAAASDVFAIESTTMVS